MSSKITTVSCLLSIFFGPALWSTKQLQERNQKTYAHQVHQLQRVGSKLLRPRQGLVKVTIASRFKFFWLVKTVLTETFDPTKGYRLFYALLCFCVTGSSFSHFSPPSIQLSHCEGQWLRRAERWFAGTQRLDGCSILLLQEGHWRRGNLLHLCPAKSFLSLYWVHWSILSSRFTQFFMGHQRLGLVGKGVSSAVKFLEAVA